eukprot:SM009057S24276  [mRNA]  locus=s9057:248:484:+ [translate_table: standard]
MQLWIASLARAPRPWWPQYVLAVLSSSSGAHPVQNLWPPLATSFSGAGAASSSTMPANFPFPSHTVAWAASLLEITCPS